MSLGWRGLLAVSLLALAGCKTSKDKEAVTPDAPAVAGSVPAPPAAPTKTPDAPQVPNSDGKAPKPAREKVVKGAERAEAREFVKLDQLRERFPGLLWWQYPENPKLATEFQAVRKSEGWKAFVRALRICDDSVNTLLDEDILNWTGADTKIGTVNRARNAWRRAVSHGIRPPRLSAGATSFEEDGLSFRLFVTDELSGVLVVRSQRGQVMGIFDLRLDDAGRQHVVSHMLELALRFPDLYLSYPWDIVMVTDTIFVPDVDVTIDRVKGEARVQNEVTGEVEVKK